MGATNEELKGLECISHHICRSRSHVRIEIHWKQFEAAALLQKR